MAHKKPSLKRNAIRFMDLFCGLGAFHEAFKKDPIFECVLACDIDEGVRGVYQANHGIEPKADIRQLDMDALPDVDLLCAGFPCQPFSIAGNGHGFEDVEKGNLFYDILGIIDRKTPRMCILENVKNLKTHDKGKTYETIVSSLTERGYEVTSKVIHAVDYGSPQARQRIFIVATKGKPFVIPEGTATLRTVSSIVDPTYRPSPLSNKYTLVATPERERERSTPSILYNVVSVATQKGGRQGERVYDPAHVGITVCASSGGPGAKTGLYEIENQVRRLNVKETLRMFGFSEEYNMGGIPSEKALFYLGNSIVVNVVDAFTPVVKAWFQGATR